MLHQKESPWETAFKFLPPGSRRVGGSSFLPGFSSLWTLLELILLNRESSEDSAKC